MSSDSTDPLADSSADVIAVRDVRKHYTLYRSPSQRIMHLFWPRKVYPRFEALKGVSFRVRRGETVGIIGQNGAGKSTLLQVITGTIPASSGEVAVHGRVAALLELGAGFEPDFTGRENITLNGTILGLTSRELTERMDAIIDFAELREFIDRPVRTYSSGMFMRLAFSVAAHVDADVLIIDEALSVGDARFTQKCMRFLKDFRQHGSILFVSHDLGAVSGLCDRAVWLDHGLIRGEGAAIDVCEQYVASMFEKPAADMLPSAHIDRPRHSVPEADQIVLYDAASALTPRGGVTSCSPFNPAASGFGIGGSAIIDAGLVDPVSGHRLDRVSEGQEVDLRIAVKAEVPVERPIFGFYIKDRLGQLLLGDNTYRADIPQVPIPAGGRMAARFRFRWPALAHGPYTLTVSSADGTMEHHVQRHWLHDAVVFEVLSSSATTSLVGLPITLVVVDRLKDEI
ncbi:MAG: ABC transporter ATP-binding protein [Rhodospirillaceae bacterium]